MFLSVVIPVYNESSTIDQIVAAVQAVELDKQIIIVDDGSTDGTREKIEQLAAAAPDGSLKTVFQKRNMGKGAALRSGFAAATGDIILIQDADLEYDPQDYPTLIEPILSGEADVVYGSRFVGAQAHRVLYFWHSIGNRLLTLLSNMFTDLNLTDMETCYKVFRREVIEQVHLCENRFGIEPEMTAKIARLRCRVFEVGIAYRGRTYAEGKKIGWRDGLRAIWCIFKYNLLAGWGGRRFE